MSLGDSAPGHAEKQISNVSSEDLPLGTGALAKDGIRTNGISANHLSAEAGPSRLRSVGSDGSTSPQHNATPKAPTKRRRLDAELAFSSPGPAFQLQQQEKQQQDGAGQQDDSCEGSARARRPRRSTTLANANEIGDTRRSRPSVSPSKGEGTRDASESTLGPNADSEPNHGRVAPPNEVDATEPTLRSDRPSRSRSSSKSTADLESQQITATGEDVLAHTLAPARLKPQITPFTALDPKTPLADILERRRQEKAALAQSDLEEVHNGHDMLVRELFHLSKFVTMVGYDPEVARNDQSDVFTNFKLSHDLSFSLDGTGSGAEASASGRVTRRRVNARLESLSLKRPHPPKTPSTPNASKNKANGKSAAAENSRSRRASSIIKSRLNVTNESDSEHSGDENGVEASGEEIDASDVDSATRARKGKGNAKATDLRRKSSSKRARLSPASQKRQLSVDDDPAFDAPVKRAGPRRSKVLDELDAFILRQQPRSLPDHPPPLHVLASHNVPALRRFGGNMDALFASFELLHDGEGGVQDDDLQAYMKLDQRWRAGLPMHPEAGSITRHIAHKVTRTKSHHDHLLDAVAASYSQMRQYTRLRQQGSRKVARMVAQHWERQLGTSDREKKAEERRVRTLAKWTLREVLKQWRLAVNVIRARKAAAEKTKKEKLDKEQLNAILEQSTAMLKKQHTAMTRTDSLPDSEDASDVTSYGSDGAAEISDSDVDFDAEEQEIVAMDAQEKARSESIPETSAPVTRDQSISTPPADGATDEIHHDEGRAIVNGATADTSSRRRQRSARAGTSTTLKTNDAKLDADDVDFDITADDGEQEDADLEQQMWDEDEEDESEDAGLEADANIPIEELMKRYGYGQAAEDGHEDAVASEEEQDASADSAVTKDAEGQTEQPFEASDEEKAIDEHSPSRADALLDRDLSDTESAATSGRYSSRRSMTRASSIVSSDRHVARSRQPFLLRGQLRPYQQIGFEWLASLYANGVNGILADEMGLGKTIQTISVLAHLACDKGVWGPHLVVAPTSVMLNWEVEFKKFLPGFKILSYYGSQKERKEKRIGWNTENSFNVCITSYQLVLADQHIFRRKPWVYLVLDEAHHIKNFRSQRWQTLLGFNSQRRLLLTGTPLQNNLMDLWSLMYFLMPHGATELPGGGAFSNMKDFQDWFSNPLDKAIEGGSMNDETREMVHKLHAVLRPYLLRRLKAEVEKELPSKYEHVITCRLSKRQRFLYNDFMSRAKTRESLASGNYLSIINCLMQLRKVCNHPDLFEVRPIVTSFAMQRSVVADYEIKELMVRRRLLQGDIWDKVDLGVTNFRVTDREEHLTAIESRDLRKLNAAKKLPYFKDDVPESAELDTWTLDGFERTRKQRKLVGDMERWKHIAYLNQYRCTKRPIYGSGLINMLREAGEAKRLEPLEQYDPRKGLLERCEPLLRIVQSRSTRRENMQPLIDRFAFVTPRAVAIDLPRWALPGIEPYQHPSILQTSFDTVHPVAVKLHIAFPDASLLQYDCGKLQQLDTLMRRLKAGGHRILIFTQMTRVLDILESFLNYHGYRYLRLDGATKVEQRQALTEKFNRDLRISAFILSTRSGGLGINLTGADTVLFYDLDWNAAIEAQCMDRAHRIGQTRDVHIYRFVTEGTIEENMLKKANQKRLLDSVVIQQGEFNTETLAKRIDWRDMLDDGGKIAGVEVGTEAGGESGREVERAFLEAEDEEDRQAAVKAREEMFVDEEDFDEPQQGSKKEVEGAPVPGSGEADDGREAEGEEEEEEGGTIDDYMLAFVERDWEFFA